MGKPEYHYTYDENKSIIDIEINKIDTLIRESRVRRGIIHKELVQN